MPTNKSALQRRNAKGFPVGTVTSIAPFQVQLDGNDSSISCLCTYSNAAIGQRVSILRIRGRQYIAIPLFAGGGVDTSWQIIGSSVVPIASGWQNYNAQPSQLTQGLSRFRKDPSGVVYFEGLLQNTVAHASGSIIFTLPPGYRPSTTRIFTVENQESTTNNGEVRINPDGTVTIQAGPSISTAAFLSLAQITYIAEDDPSINVQWTDLALLNSWTNLGGGLANAGYYVDNSGDVHLRGVIARTAAPAAASAIATLPAGLFRTDNQQVWPVAANGGMARVDIGITGSIAWEATSTGATNAYLSLDGIVLNLGVGTSIMVGSSIVSPWVAYGAPYASPRFLINKYGVMRGDGLAKSGAASANITASTAQLLMPNTGMIYKTVANNQSARIDLSTTAYNTWRVEVVTFTTGASNAFVSFNPIIWLPTSVDF